MRLMLIILSGTMFCCNSSSPPSVKTPVILQDTISFAQEVQPILSRRCSPCHFTGGKMYQRMPFDTDTTLVAHQAGILKRIKDEKENSLIRKFLEQKKEELK